MKKPSIMGLFCIVPLITGAIQSDKIVVSLTMPGEEMLFLEMTPIVVTLSNGTDRIIPVIKNNDLALRVQIKLDVGAMEPHAHSPIPATDDTYKKWLYLSKAKDTLNPGESFSWTLPRFTELTVFSYHVKATNIAAKVLIGDNEWVCSAPVPFGISKEDVEGRGLLKESPEIDCYDAKTKVKTKTSVRRVSLGNKTFLFTNDGNRLFEISNDDVPKAFFDSENGIMSFVFPKSERIVMCDPKTAKIVQERAEKE
ncbi:MAG: hypothetical protein EOM59_19415 [Clostridia bacterium]|jgi:hypothetical protein|nr:hypothetical protein [Kiritimatiellia bacterium]MDX9793623.1 hypothetical protein [Kiritimatiellia bacterium]NCB44765.1 hypothetical protein [Clostridia bacterium]